MNTMKRKQIYNDALNKYGIRNQKEMVYEKIGELLNALAESNGNKVTVKELITELADVHIMVEQMAFFYGWDEFKAEKDHKLERLQERLLVKGEREMTDKEKLFEELEAKIKAFTEAHKDEDPEEIINVCRGNWWLEESESEDLEEEIERYIDPLTPADVLGGPFTSLEKCARHFANWQKEHMMKDAIEGIYDCDDDNSWIEFKGWVESASRAGDKVKIIIIKEEGK